LEFIKEEENGLQFIEEGSVLILIIQQYERQTGEAKKYASTKNQLSLLSQLIIFTKSVV